MTDHHDFADHHFDDHHDPLPFDDPGYPAPEQHWDDDVHHDEAPAEPDPPEPHAGAGAGEVPAEPVADPAGPVADAAGHDFPLDPAEDPAGVFPPPVDVGELPEPVDGFPWIDSGSLGLADIAAALHEADATEPVQPQELAEYAATDLPPGVDPWAALADSDDPATSALARWWSQP